MFKGRHFAARYFASRYFGEGGAAAPVPTVHGVLPESRSRASELRRGTTGSASRSFTRPDGVRR